MVKAITQPLQMARTDNDQPCSRVVFKDLIIGIQLPVKADTAAKLQR